MSSAGRWLPWREAWTSALYGPGGFYTVAAPADHFRTSVHASPLFARAVMQLVRDAGLDTVVDLGAGTGELLRQLSTLSPDLRLIGVELRPRPATLPPGIEWDTSAPGRLEGLVVANELLDNLACDVVERAGDGTLRVVEVNVDTGQQRLGDVADPAVSQWVETWWPSAGPGQRAEVGLVREDMWANVCERMAGGLCVAVDFGHLRDTRPPGGSLVSYRAGRQTPVRLDGAHDITASVAMDALAARVGGTLTTQRDVLRRLGITGQRPSLALASSDPLRYVRELATATQAAELTAVDGLGSFWWLFTPASGADTPAWLHTWQHDSRD